MNPIGCPACDDCYALIQSRKNDINRTIVGLRENLDEIQNNPITVNDSEFDERVQQVKAELGKLHGRTEQKFGKILITGALAIVRPGSTQDKMTLDPMLIIHISKLTYKLCTKGQVKL
jgi:hypothetical protein